MRIGTSGWNYPEWRGDYYPRDLAHLWELEYLADRMSTVELNGSFYSLRRPSTYRAWHDRTPEEFVFAVKGNRFITHVRRLRDAHETVANFLASGVLELRAKLGPVLWQFPATMAFDPVLLGEFLAALPRDHRSAADLIAKHATRWPDEPSTVRPTSRRLRHAVEARHPSFAAPAFRDLLRIHDVASVRADTAGRWPYFDFSTADFSYVRLHGATELYVSEYSPAELADWAARIQNWVKAGDVYVYFDNTARAAAPRDAECLAGLVRGT